MSIARKEVSAEIKRRLKARITAVKKSRDGERKQWECPVRKISSPKKPNESKRRDGGGSEKRNWEKRDRPYPLQKRRSDQNSNEREGKINGR
jgi:hypothetical protein